MSILTKSGVRKLQQLETDLKALQPETDETTALMYSNSLEFIQSILNYSVPKFAWKRTAIEKFFYTVFNSEDSIAIEVFNDTTRTMAKQFIAFIENFNLETDLSKLVKIFSDNSKQELLRVIQNLETKIHIYEHLSQKETYEHLELYSATQALKAHAALNTFLIENHTDDFEAVINDFKNHIEDSAKTFHTLPFMRLSYNDSLKAPYQLDLTKATIAYTSSGAKILGSLFMIQENINSYCELIRESKISLVEEWLSTQNENTPPLSIKEIVDDFTPKANSYQNKYGKSQSSFSLSTRIIQPKDVQLLIDIVAILNLAYEKEQTAPGQFIRCFNKIHQRLHNENDQTTFDKLSTNHPYLITDLLQSLSALIRQLKISNDPYLQAMLKPNIIISLRNE